MAVLLMIASSWRDQLTRLPRLFNDGDKSFGCSSDVHGIARLQLGFGNQFRTDSKRRRARSNKGSGRIEADAAGGNQRNVWKWTSQSMDVFRSSNIAARKDLHEVGTPAPCVQYFSRC